MKNIETKIATCNTNVVSANIIIRIDESEAEDKFQVGETYFVLDNGNPFTLKVEARTEKMLTGTTVEGTRKYHIHATIRGELVNVKLNDEPAQIWACNTFDKYLQYAANNTEPNVDDYAVSTEAQDVATDAEIELANNTTALVPVEFYNRQKVFEQQLTGNYSTTINGEFVTFKNFSIVRIDASNKLNMTYHHDSKNKIFRLGGHKIAAAKIAANYVLKEQAVEQGKAFHAFFDNVNQTGNFFDVVSIVTYADGVDHNFCKSFDTLPQATDHINQILANFPDINATIVIKSTLKSYGNYKTAIYRRNNDGTVTADIPDTQAFRNYSTTEIKSRLTDTLKAIRDNDDFMKTVALDKTANSIWYNLYDACSDLRHTYKILEFCLHDGTPRFEDFNNLDDIANLIPSVNAFDQPDDDDELIDTPDVTETVIEEKIDDFAAKLAALKAERDAAEADFELKISARKAAEKAEDLAADKFNAARRAYEKFGDDKAKELRNKLITSDIRATNDLLIYDQEGSVYCPALKSLDIWFFRDKFEIRCDKEASSIVYKFATYDTPEQVTAAIDQLKVAIAHDKQDFQFPTVDDLNQPLVLPTNISDSLERAMKIAQSKFQDFCRTGQLTRAEHELKLYNICRRAKIQLSCGNDEPPPEFQFKPHVISHDNTVEEIFSSPEETLQLVDLLTQINKDAPEGWQITCDGKAFTIKYKGNVVATLDSLATAKALPPDKFFAQFTPLVDKNFEPKEIFIQDLYRERSELLAMREELPDDSDRLPTIDAMIKQLERDIAKAEFAEYERTGIPQWF